MLKRGRKSTAELAVITGNFGQRPDPPEGLSVRQSEIWRRTVASEAEGLFNTEVLRSLLQDYCQHREAAENVSEIINTFQSEWLKSAEGAKRYHGLLKMRDLETRAAISAARSLRLTNQSRYTPMAAATAARNAARGRMPWEE